MSNLLLYLAYLALTGLGIGHKTAMTALYATGVCLTFLFNRNWTFGHSGRLRKSFAAYLGIYLFGYVVNYCALLIFVDRLGFRHEWVQGVMILFIAVLMFALQKFFVFAPKAEHGDPHP